MRADAQAVPRAGSPGAAKAGLLGCLVLIAALVCAALPAAAQVFETPDADLPVALIADSITYDAETGRVIAEGSVEVYYGERTLTAERIVYDDRTRRISAEGQLALRDPTGVTVFADMADLDVELTEGLVRGARSVMGEHVRLAAVEARRVDERFNTLSKAVYSPCRVCPDNPTPLWRIRARRVIHDEVERVIHYENATFDVFGVPIAWLPYFRHPDPTVDRMSGFLTPDFQSSSTYGYGFKLPYYWVIDDQSDLTLAPFYTTSDGLILEGEYRRAFRSGELSFAGSITADDFIGSDRLHGHVDTNGLFAVTDEINAGWDIVFTSDDDYLRRYDFGYGDRLTSELFVNRYRPDGFFDVSGVYFQSLRENEPAGQIPIGAPVVDARYNTSEPWLDGDVGLFTSGHLLTRNNGRDDFRITFGADWQREEILPWGLALTGFAEARADFFWVGDDPTITDDFTPRLTGHVGIEARFPLVTDEIDGVTHLIEPVVQGIVAPYGGNDPDIPFEDSLVTEFDETNVIDRNHFSGLDNFESGPRLNVALRYERIVDDGLRFNASVGQVYRLRPVNAFSSGSGLRDTQSDFVTAWEAEYDPYVRVRHRMRFSDDATITRNELFGTVLVDPVEFNVGYVFLESDPDIGAFRDREEVDARMDVQIDRNWAVSGFLQRDLQLGEFVQVGGAVSYENECCAVDFYVRRRFTETLGAPAATSVGVQVRLLTLGEVNDG